MLLSLEFTEINLFISKMRRSVNRSRYGVHRRTTEEQIKRENGSTFHILTCNTIEQVWREKKELLGNVMQSVNIILCVTFEAER